MTIDSYKSQRTILYWIVRGRIHPNWGIWCGAQEERSFTWKAKHCVYLKFWFLSSLVLDYLGCSSLPYKANFAPPGLRSEPLYWSRATLSSKATAGRCFLDMLWRCFYSPLIGFPPEATGKLNGPGGGVYWVLFLSARSTWAAFYCQRFFLYPA